MRKMDNAAWWSGSVRMYHPNMRDLDVSRMDFDRFVSEAEELDSAAVVISAGGLIAFYPTRIPYHVESQLLEGRDFVGEVTRRAKQKGIRVIARVDFSCARAPVVADHPEWFCRDLAGDTLKRRGNSQLNASCPNGAYRREAFAWPVLNELIDKYDVDGFHVNGGNWQSLCYCDNCRRAFRASFAADLPVKKEADPELWARFIEWRYSCIADYFSLLRSAAQTKRPDILLIGETFIDTGSYDTVKMAEACTVPLITTGEVLDGPGKEVRSSAGLAARFARTANHDRQPLVNLKVFMKSGGWPRSMVPPAEYRLWLWQALANGAGLKLPVFGTLDQEDRRNIPAVSEAFRLMKAHAPIFGEAVPIAPVALVWPHRTLNHWTGPAESNSSAWFLDSDVKGGYAGSGSALARAAFKGMYNALVEAHIPFDVVQDTEIANGILADRDYSVVVLAGAACLEDGAVDVLTAYAREGGGLLCTGWSGWADEWGRNRLEPALAGLSGYRALPLPPIAVAGLYMAPDQDGHLDQAGLLTKIEDAGLITADGPAPPVEAVLRHESAMSFVKHNKVLPVEAIDDPAQTEASAVVLHVCGAGRVATILPPLDALYTQWGLGDHRQLLINALHWCSAHPLPIETEAPETVEVTLTRRGEDRIVHFVNATGLEPLRDVIPLEIGTTMIALAPHERCTSVQCLRQSRVLPFTRTSDGVSFQLGHLDDYEIVVLTIESDH